jgi:TrmH family RNA methyltransferase
LAAIRAALVAGRDIALVLAAESARGPAFDALRAELSAKGIPIRFESDREMRRMSRFASDTPEAPLLAVEGRPPAVNLSELMPLPGIVFGLVGLRYPGNVGFILRSVEVAGGAGVVLESDWGEAQMEEASRTGMRPERFMSVLRAPVDEMVSSAREAGRGIIAVETSGDIPPWQAPLASPALVLVGSERSGLPESVLRDADAVVRIPSGGFIPSYNVQAAVGICLGEWLRQTEDPSA